MFSRTVAKNFHVAVLGAAGGIGQPLSTLMKLNPMVTRLSLYDVVASPGVAADLSHISTPATVQGYLRDEIEKALTGAQVVLIPAGVPRKPGMTRDDLFNTNANIVKSLAESCAKYCPKAAVLIIANPVNSTVPIAAEVYKKAGVYDPRKIFGVTTLDIVRAKTFVAGAKKLNPFDVTVEVIGGHSGPTIVPLLSRTGLQFNQDEVDKLTHRIQYGGDEVVKAKDGAGSATLSMAYAGAEFAFSVIQGMRGDKGIAECTFVENPTAPTKWFSTKVELGAEGVEKIHPIPQLNKYEEGLLEKCVTELKANIEKGVKHVNQ